MAETEYREGAYGETVRVCSACSGMGEIEVRDEDDNVVGQRSCDGCEGGELPMRCECGGGLQYPNLSCRPCLRLEAWEDRE